jgi:hypothetical protein
VDQFAGRHSEIAPMRAAYAKAPATLSYCPAGWPGGPLVRKTVFGTRTDSVTVLHLFSPL